MSSACVMIVLRLEIITFAREIMLDPDRIMLLAMCQAMKGKTQTTQTNHYYKKIPLFLSNETCGLLGREVT